MTDAKSNTFQTACRNANYSGVEDVSPEEIRQKKDSVHLIDVREADEFNGSLGHIQNAVLVPLSELESRWEEIPKDGTKIMICRSGNRSGKACQFLKSKGIESIYNLQGGMMRWNDLGYEVEK